MIINRTFLFIALILLLACQQEIPDSTVKISGKVNDDTDQFIKLQELEVRSLVPVDSVKAVSGQFQFDIAIEQPGFYVLQVNDTLRQILLLSPDENVKVTFDKNLMPLGCEIQGSDGSELLLDFDRFMLNQKEQLDSLALVYNQSRGAGNYMKVKESLDSLYERIVDAQRKYVFDFLEQNPQSLASLIVLNRPLGKTPVIDEEDDFKYFYNLDSTLSAVYPGNKHVKDHSDRVKEIKGRLFDRLMAEEKVLPGRKAPDIVLNDTTGEPYSLKSLLGKPVLIYFWAGWDAASRQENKKLKKFVPEIENKEIGLLGVSLDNNESVWRGALRLDKLPFKQVSDLEAYSSSVVESYNIPKNLPFYYLLDAEHKIFYKNSSLDSVLVKLDELTLQTK